MNAKPIKSQIRPHVSYAEIEERSLFRRLLPRHLRWPNRITRLATGHTGTVHTHSQSARHYTTERGERIYLLVCFLLRTFLTNYDSSKVIPDIKLKPKPLEILVKTIDPIVKKSQKVVQIKPEMLSMEPSTIASNVQPDTKKIVTQKPPVQLKTVKESSIRTKLRAKLNDDDDKSVVSLFLTEKSLTSQIAPSVAELTTKTTNVTNNNKSLESTHKSKKKTTNQTEKLKPKINEMPHVTVRPGLISINDQKNKNKPKQNISIPVISPAPKLNNDEKALENQKMTSGKYIISLSKKNDTFFVNSSEDLSKMPLSLDNRNHFYRLLHELQPITNVQDYLSRFKGSSELLAIRHCKELESALKSWETSALHDLEQCKSALLNIRNLELLLLFAEEQQRALQTLVQRRARQINHLQQEQQQQQNQSWELKKSVASFFGLASTSSVIKSSSSLDHKEEMETKLMAENRLFTEFQVVMCVKGEPIRCDLSGALQLVQLVKHHAEQQVQVRCVYVRCIKELLRINVSNLMRVYTWSLRLRCCGISSVEADKGTAGRS